MLHGEVSNLGKSRLATGKSAVRRAVEFSPGATAGRILANLEKFFTGGQSARSLVNGHA
jgi:hypothetical protein